MGDHASLEAGIERAARLLQLNAAFQRSMPKLSMRIERHSVCVGFYVTRHAIYIYPIPFIVMGYRRKMKIPRLPTVRGYNPLS